MSRPTANHAPVETKRYALYVRVSDQKQLAGREYDSLESQEAFLREWVARHRGEVHHVYSDIRSGTQLEERDGLVALIADARAGRFEVAVAYNFDRWCRSLDIHTTIGRVERETGVRFVSATQELPDDAEGELAAGQLAVINQYYSRVISKKVRLKRRLRADRGEWNGGRRPYGYTSERAKLAIVPAEAAVVRQMFDLYLEHPSAITVRNRLRALGIKDRKGLDWNNSSVEVILRNPIYAGYIRGEGEQLLPGIHEPIITAATWDAAQKTLPTRRRLVTKVKRPFPLLGILRCGHCDAAMTVSYVKKPNGHVVPYYRCSRTYKRGWSTCPIKQVNATRIEKWIVLQLRALNADPTLLDAVLAAINDIDAAHASPLRDREAQILARAREVTGRIDNLVNAIAAGGSAFDSIRAQLTLEERNKRLLDLELGQVRGEIERTAGSPLDPATVRRVLGDFELLYAVATPDEQRELLRLLIRRIVYRGPAEQTSMEFYSNVHLQDHGSILRASMLPGLDLN